MEDRHWLAGKVMRVAASLGFDAVGRARVGIAVSELVSNAAKFAGHGTLRVDHFDDRGPVLRIIVEDDGPGIPSPEDAARDGFSEGRLLEPSALVGRRGLGTGLGAVKRLASSLEIEAARCGGAKVTVTFRPHTAGREPL